MAGKTCHLTAIFSPFQAPPLIFVHHGQELIRARDMFLPPAVYLSMGGLPLPDAVQVIEIEDESGKKSVACEVR